MRIGYVRCSTADQNPDRQIVILREAGCEKVYSDMLSGKDTNRPGLQDMMNFARSGDEIFVESISRLARSTKDLLNILERLKEKDVSFISQKENIDTSTPQGQFMLTVFAAMADLERQQMLQRQKEGIAIAKQKGVYKGRKPKEYDPLLFDDLYRHWIDGDIKQSYMCKMLGVSRSTLSRLLVEKRKSYQGKGEE